MTSSLFCLLSSFSTACAGFGNHILQGSSRFLHANRHSPRIKCGAGLRLKTLWNKKKGAPTCAGAPQRSGHCRVCAQTGVVGATPGRIAPRENSHVVSALRVLGDVEALT